MLEVVTRQLITNGAEVLRELEAYRVQEKLTHTEIARLCGISYSRYTVWRSSGDPSRVMLMRKSYGQQLELIAGGANESA